MNKKLIGTQFFLHTPYEPGVSLRWDIHHSQFKVEVMGMLEYPEDDPMYGTYQTEGTLSICETPTLTDAVNKLKVMYQEDNWPFRDEEKDYYDPDFGRDMGPRSFSPRTVIIYDRYNRKVLGGELSRGSVTWARPIKQEAEFISLDAKCKSLQEKGSYEHGWDNYDTARSLWYQADLLLLHVVDSKYLLHDEINNIFLQDASVSWNDRF
ncbi:hypothetical protein PSI19_03130 [Xenorhabdus khoisanae]|uniref:hypothetical protein n=1 Tax=Xenorhabdus khoisanae TaxID=880157 RepID=UPI002358B117|nr:hypothetical protein [Xenorhabdus khoisanae]MDC9612890.1 hypothetical protein [Xenorhabdus khoisanae]